MVGKENTIIGDITSSRKILIYLDFVKIKYCIALDAHCLTNIDITFYPLINGTYSKNS